MNRIGKTVRGWIKNAQKFLQVEEMDHDLGLLEVINPKARPIEVKEQLGHPVKVAPGLGRINISADSNNVTALSGAAQAVEVPVKGAEYILMAVGNTAYVCQDGTASAGCAGVPCSDGVPVGPIPLNRDLSICGGAVGGFFYLIRKMD